MRRVSVDAGFPERYIVIAGRQGRTAATCNGAAFAFRRRPRPTVRFASALWRADAELKSDLGHRRPSGLTSSLANLAGLSLPLLLFLGVTPVLVRLLGTEHYGVLAIFLSVTALSASFDFGLGTAAVKGVGAAIARGDTEHAALLQGEFFSAFLWAGVLLGAGIWLSSAWLGPVFGIDAAAGPERSATVIRSASVSIAAALVTTAASTVPKTMELYSRLVLIQVGSSAAFLLGATALAWTGSDVDRLAIFHATIGVATALGVIAWSRRFLSGWKVRPFTRFPVMRRYLAFGLFAFLGQFSAVTTYHADKLLIAYFLGPGPVAYYSIASNLASKILSVAAASAAYVFPRAVALHSEGNATALRDTYFQSSRFVLLLTAPLVAPSLVLADRFFEVWIGPDGSALMPQLFRILLVAYFVASASVVASNVFAGMGNTRIGAGFSLLGCAVNIVSCMVLIPRYGPVGAALASLLGMAQVFVFVGALERHFDPRRIGQVGLWLSILLAALVQGAVVFALRPVTDGWFSLLGVGFLGWLAYYLFWFGTGMANESDRRMAARLLRLGRA